MIPFCKYTSGLLRIGRSEAGAVGVKFALMATALMSMVGVVLDGGSLYVTKSRLQTAADAAALAAYSKISDRQAAIKQAKLFAAKNARSTDGTVLCAKQVAVDVEGDPVIEQDTEGVESYCSGDIAFGNWDYSTRKFTVGGTPVNAIRIIAKRSEANGNASTLIFAKVFGRSIADVAVMSIAAAGGSPTCMLALNKSDSGSVSLDSNANITLKNCGLQVNSSSGAGLKTDSNTKVVSDWISVVGSYNRLGSSSISPTPKTGADPKADPLASLPAPATAGCNHWNKMVYDNVTTTINPGIYCGGIEIKGDAVVTMSPGINVVKDGALFVDSNSKLLGAGVMIYLTGGDGLVKFDSNAKIQLSAPKTGTYAGILFFQDRNFGGEHSFDSNTDMKLEGVSYFPKGTVSVNSNATSALTGCSFFVADKFMFNSNGGFNITYQPANCGVPIPRQLTGLSRLVQ